MKNKTIKVWMSQIVNNLWANIKIIFLGGILVGLLFAAYYIVKDNMVKYKYNFMFEATIEAYPNFSSSNSAGEITVEECKSAIFGSEAAENILRMLGKNTDLDDFKNNITISVNQNNIVLKYCDTNNQKSVQVAEKALEELTISLRNNGRVAGIEKTQPVKTEKVKKKVEANMKFGLTQMIELGILLGMFLFGFFVTIEFLVKGTICDSYDVYHYLELPVLSEIPTVYDKGDWQ